jgi:FkbM family methyltransferase
MSGVLRSLARAALPPGAREALRETLSRDARTRHTLARVRARMAAYAGRPGRTRCGPFTVRFNDGLNYYMSWKDIFVHRIYHFESSRPDPRILDCGSNIGLSVLYAKRAHPAARVTAFEADPEVLPLLRENLAGNGVSGVEVVEAVLGAREGTVTLTSEGACGSYVAGSTDVMIEAAGAASHTVRSVRLRGWLDGPVDFLKMNIEGAEWEVLEDSGDRLRSVREMVIEYHHLPRLPRTLHRILDLLDRRGFEYLIHDLDYESNGGVRPPFTLDSESRYFLLIYARRLGEA